jgi:hypothetical protein
MQTNHGSLDILAPRCPQFYSRYPTARAGRSEAARQLHDSLYKGYDHGIMQATAHAAVCSPMADGDRNAALSNPNKSLADRRATGHPPRSSPTRRAAPSQIAHGSMAPLVATAHPVIPRCVVGIIQPL